MQRNYFRITTALCHLTAVLQCTAGDMMYTEFLVLGCICCVLTPLLCMNADIIILIIAVNCL